MDDENDSGGHTLLLVGTASGRCAHCHTRLAAHGSTAMITTLRDTESDTALQVRCCSDACAMLLAEQAPIEGLFLFDVSIPKLLPFGRLANDEQDVVTQGTLTFAVTPLQEANLTPGKLHLEMFSPNNRKRTINYSLPVQYNLQARAIANTGIYTRRFKLSPSNRKQVRLVDFFNRKNKPRLVRFTGVPAADPDPKRRLRETVQLSLAAGSSDEDVSNNKRYYVARIGAAQSKTAGDPKRQGYLVLQMDNASMVLTDLFVISTPVTRVPSTQSQSSSSKGKGLLGRLSRLGRRNDEELYDVPGPLPPAPAQQQQQEQERDLKPLPPPIDQPPAPAPAQQLQQEGEEDLPPMGGAPQPPPPPIRERALYGDYGYDDYAEYDEKNTKHHAYEEARGGARRQPFMTMESSGVGAALGQMAAAEDEEWAAPFYAVEDDEKAEDDEGMLMVGDRILFRASDKVRPLFSRTRFQRGELTRDARTGSSIKNRSARADLALIEDNRHLRTTFLTLLDNDLALLLNKNVKQTILPAWTNPRSTLGTAVKVYNAFVKSELYALPARAVGSLAQRRTESRTDRLAVTGLFASVTTPAYQPPSLRIDPQDPSDPQSEAWRTRLYATNIRTARHITLLGDNSSSNLYLDDFYVWQAPDQLPDAKAARTVGLTLRLGAERDARGNGGGGMRAKGKVTTVEAHVRLDIGYQSAFEQGRPPGPPMMNDVTVLIASLPPSEPRKEATLLALVFRLQTTTDLIAKSGVKAPVRLRRWRLTHLVHYEMATANLRRRSRDTDQ